MKLYDALSYLMSRRPINFKKTATLEEFLISTATYGTPPDKELAQKMLDAEELFLPADTRTLAQLQNPRWIMQQADLPDGISGIMSDGITDWYTDSSRPFDLTTVYTRSLL